MPTAREVMNFYIKNYGYSPLAAAGLVGNFAAESGNFNDAVIKGNIRGDDGSAFGLAQWRGARQRNLVKFAKAKGLDIYDWRTQAAFAHEETKPQSPYADFGAIKARKIALSAKTLRDATQAWYHFERGAGYEKRKTEGLDAHIANDERILAATEAYKGVKSTQRANFNNSRQNIVYSNEYQQGDSRDSSSMYPDDMDPLNLNYYSNQRNNDYDNISYNLFGDEYKQDYDLTPSERYAKVKTNPLNFSESPLTNYQMGINSVSSVYNPFTNQNIGLSQSSLSNDYNPFLGKY